MKRLIFFVILAVLGAIFAITRQAVLPKQLSVSPTPTPTLTPTATPIPVGIPKIISIPSLNVKALVESVTVDELGRMDVPENYNNAGWYSPGPKPGEAGSAVIDGHVDTPQGNPSIFADIDKLSEGDLIVITDVNGIERSFQVKFGENYPLSTMPLPYIFDTKTPDKRLNLITCSGNWDTDQKMYTDRYVVYAVME